MAGGNVDERLEALEGERADEVAKAHAALAAAQDRSYWLDRWNVDLNALMRRREGTLVRAAFRALRAMYRLAYDARNRADAAFGDSRDRVTAARTRMERERADTDEGGSETDGSTFAFGQARTLSPIRLEAAPITDLLYSRLTDEDVAVIRQRLTPPEAAVVEAADAPDRKRFLLALAAKHGLDGPLARTGLSAAMPPESVHAMARGTLAAGGAYYYADIVADGLRQSGAELEAGQAVLDFGCSSGRVVRALAAALPELEWRACDPIAEAIQWAAANLPGIAFERSPEYPPLPHADVSLDVVYAISIWSHFSEQAALDWFTEMRRVLKPGGRLAFTAHGEQTIAHTHRVGQRSDEQLSSVQAGLFQRGFWYAPEFGLLGDHGVANADWGTAFLSAEWLLTRLTPDWQVTFFRPGRAEDNQDLYVLERR